MKTIHVVGAAIIEHGRCLVAQRGPGMALAGKWEFPGGKVRDGESKRHALMREIREELGLEIRVGDHLGSGGAQVGDLSIRLCVYQADWIGGELTLVEHAQTAWTDRHELFDFDWAEADVPVLDAVAALL